MQTSGKASKKHWSSTAAHQSDASQADFDRLTAAISTPRIEKSNQKRSPDEITEAFGAQIYEGEDSGTNVEDATLQEEMEKLMELNEEREISDDDLRLLMDYVDDKLAQGVPRSILAARIRSEAQRSFCLKSIKKEKKKNNGRTREDQQNVGYLRTPDPA